MMSVITPFTWKWNGARIRLGIWLSVVTESLQSHLVRPIRMKVHNLCPMVAMTNQILECMLRVHQDFTHQDKVQEYGPSMKRTSGAVAGYVYYLYVNESNTTTIKE